MKKDKAVRKAELKAGLINMLKGLIAPAIGILVIVAIVLLVRFLQKPADAEAIIEMHSYSGTEDEIVVDNGKLVMRMDPMTTHFSVEVKETGEIWYSNPVDADSDPIALTLDKQLLNSTLILYYSTKNGVDTLFNNYAYSIEKGIYDIETGEDYIKVFYSVGDTEKEYIIPIVIEESRMEDYLAQMDTDSKTRVKDYYKKYDINKLGKKDDPEELLSKYPMLADTVIYVLRDTAKDNIKTKLEEYFAAAGYTYEEYEADKEFAGESKTSDKPVFNVNIVYRLEGDQLVVDVPLEEIEYKEKYPLYNLVVLPYFGAGSTTDEGYLMVPEGGGALINFNNGKTAQNSYYSDLYGWDAAQDRLAKVNETHSAFNAFGIARNNSSFICILEQGAPYAGIFADISGKQNSYNFVYPRYTLIHREKYEMGQRIDGAMYIYEAGIPKEHIVERFCFIGSNDYVDMAKAYQNYLVEQYGDAFARKSDESTPTVLEFIGAVDKIEQICGIPTSVPLELTTYAETKAILEQIQSEGMSNISVRLTGWANHGVKQRMFSNVKPVSKLGSKKDLLSLTNYANSNGIDLYLNGVTDYAYDSDIFDGFFVFTDVARFANNQKAEITPYSTIFYGIQDWMDSYYLLAPEVIDEMVDNFVDAAGKYNANVAFEEIGNELNSDYHKRDITTRQTIMNKEVATLQEIQNSGKKVLIDVGNAYAVPYSDMITNMNLFGYRYSIIDRTVPVYQIALHGYKNYTGESLNLTQNFEEELLGSAEYGAGLSFTLMDETAFTLQNTLYTQYFGAEYDACHDSMMETYTRYNNELGHTFCQTIVNHDVITETLRITEYEDGTKVYVNYGYDVATVDGVTVGARDYLVVR